MSSQAKANIGLLRRPPPIRGGANRGEGFRPMLRGSAANLRAGHLRLVGKEEAVHEYRAALSCGISSCGHAAVSRYGRRAMHLGRIPEHQIVAGKNVLRPARQRRK